MQSIAVDSHANKSTILRVQFMHATNNGLEFQILENDKYRSVAQPLFSFTVSHVIFLKESTDILLLDRKLIHLISNNNNVAWEFFFKKTKIKTMIFDRIVMVYFC